VTSRVRPATGSSSVSVGACNVGEMAISALPLECFATLSRCFGDTLFLRSSISGISLIVVAWRLSDVPGVRSMAQTRQIRARDARDEYDRRIAVRIPRLNAPSRPESLRDLLRRYRSRITSKQFVERKATKNSSRMQKRYRKGTELRCD